MLIASSPHDFSFIENHSPFFFIYNTAVQAAGFFIFWPLCLFLLFSNKKIFALTGLALVAFSLCGMFVFPGNYGVLTQDMIFPDGIEHSLAELLVNFGVLCAVFFIISFIFRKVDSKIIIPVSLICGAAILIISFRNFAFIQTEYSKETVLDIQREAKTSIEPVFHFSKTGKNTVVLMLDKAMSAFFPLVLEEIPELNDHYSGFVYYPNTLSFSSYTHLGAPPIFGGYEYIPTELNKRTTVSMREKHNEALLCMPIIFSNHGYQVTVTDPPYPNYSHTEDLRLYGQYHDINAFMTNGRYTDIWLKENTMILPSLLTVLKRNILWYSLFKMMPYFLREGVYQQGAWFASFSGHNIRKTIDSYAVLDFLPRLTDFNAGKENAALLMVNNTTHDPSPMQAPDYRPVLTATKHGSGRFVKDTAYQVNAAALLRLAEWFYFLKHENVYDNTRIIIVADHGTQKNYISPMNRDFSVNIDAYNPLLLVKDFYASGSIKRDDTFMTNADVPFLALQGQIKNPINPFTGVDISVVLKKDPLYIACSTGSGLEDPESASIYLNPKKDYYVYGNIFDPANWERVEK
jgi:hypothetical protein